MKSLARILPVIILLTVTFAPLVARAQECRIVTDPLGIVSAGCFCGTFFTDPLSGIRLPFPGLSHSSSELYCFAGNFINIINEILVPLLFAVAFIVFLYGVAKAYIFSGGSEDARSEGHKLILWGLIGFFVMISLWGLVNVLVNTAGLAGYGPGPLPDSRPQ